MADAWTFGWKQLLTIADFAITIGIAWTGFRTFERWRREKIEEKRIDTAVEALALAYESKFVFDNIRSPMSFPYEWKDMPDSFGTEEQQRALAGSSTRSSSASRRTKIFSNVPGRCRSDAPHCSAPASKKPFC